MSATITLLLVLYALGMAIGQLLFKMAADSVVNPGGRGFVLALAGSWAFLLAVLVYACLTVLWVWILTKVPLSRAYPFVVLAFAFTPALAFAVLGESVNGWYFVGLALILMGLSVLVVKAG